MGYPTIPISADTASLICEADALQAVLVRFLTQHGTTFPNLKAVYFDPFNECANSRQEIDGISLMARPLLQLDCHLAPMADHLRPFGTGPIDPLSTNFALLKL